MIIRQLIVLLLSLSALTFSALAADRYEFETGNDVFEKCNLGSSNPSQTTDFESVLPVTFCGGWASGLMDGIMLVEGMTDTKVICAPPEASPSEILLIVKRYLSTHNEYMDSNKSTLVYSALVDAYPCTDAN